MRTLPIDADQWWVFDPTMDREHYVREILELYRTTPTTCGRVRPDDHRLALSFYQQRIPFTAVEGAFVLAADRRARRDATRPALAPIQSLRYFQPILREILDTPIDPADISYLWHKMLGNH
jgi:hypothetical protein